MTRRQLLAFALAVLAALALAGFLLALGVGREEANLTGPGPYRGSEPPAGIRLPAFSLRDVISGDPVETSDLRGEVALITFLDTDCVEACPILAAEIADALRLLPASVRTETRALAISVDPEIDTRASVVRFLAAQNAEEIEYLSGAVPQLRPVWRGFNIVSAYETGDANTHSADVRIFDPDGMWVSTQHAGADLSPGNLAHDIRRALED